MWFSLCARFWFGETHFFGSLNLFHLLFFYLAPGRYSIFGGNPFWFYHKNFFIDLVWNENQEEKPIKNVQHKYSNGDESYKFSIFFILYFTRNTTYTVFFLFFHVQHGMFKLDNWLVMHFNWMWIFEFNIGRFNWENCHRLERTLTKRKFSCGSNWVFASKFANW